MKIAERLLNIMFDKMLITKTSDAYSEAYKKGYEQAYKDLEELTVKTALSEGYLLQLQICKK